MAVFIELTTDAYEENLRKQALRKRGKENRSSRAGRRVARRPLRGIEIKEDTYAMIKVIDASGQTIPLVDSTSPDGRTKGYASFMLQQVSDARMEKHQLVETFGDSYIFFFGEAPRFIEVTAVLLNSHDFNWRAEWWENYEDLLRGTRLVENGARMYLFYDDIIVEGYLVQARVGEASAQPYQVTLNFKLFVTNYSNISLIGNPNFPIRSSVVLPEGVDLTRGNAGSRLINAYRGQALDAIATDEFNKKASNAKTTSEGGTNPDGSTSFSEQFGPFESTGFASSGNGQAAAGTTFGTIGSQPKSSQNPIAAASRISDALRAVPPSFGVSQDVWNFLFTNATFQQQTQIRNLVIRKGRPIRGLIAENTDEFVGVSERASLADVYSFDLAPDDNVPSAVKGTIRNRFEVDDLWREAIQFLSCYGADINNADALISLGLGPNFQPEVSIGLGGEKVSFNPFTDEGQKKGSDFFENQVEQIGTSFEQFAQDPLGNVFGRPKGSTNDQSLQNRPRYTEGAGDPFYGYPSDFAEGQPGFGVPGFGDFGGKGFGSGQGSKGDPGFKDPEKFTFAGVSNEQGAFDRFLKPKEDPTSITLGAGISLGTSGVSGGAGIAVNGKPTAFALVSVPGLLDEEGKARQAAEAIAKKQAQQKFGFANDNPFGVNCPSPGLGFNEGASFSDGFEYTLP